MEASAETQLNDSIEGIFQDGKAIKVSARLIIFASSLQKKRAIHRVNLQLPHPHVRSTGYCQQ